MFGNRRMPNGMSEEAQLRGHAVWEGAPCKGALYPIRLRISAVRVYLFSFPQDICIHTII